MIEIRDFFFSIRLFVSSDEHFVVLEIEQIAKRWHWPNCLQIS